MRIVGVLTTLVVIAAMVLMVAEAKKSPKKAKSSMSISSALGYKDKAKKVKK